MSDEPEEVTQTSAMESYETLERQAKASSKSRKRGAGHLLKTPLYIPSIPPSLLQHAAERSSGMAAESGAGGGNGVGVGGKEGGLAEEEEEGEDEREARREKRRAQRKKAARAQHAEEVKALGGKAALAAADKRQRGLLAKGTLSTKVATTTQLLAPGMTVEVVGSGSGSGSGGGGGGATTTSGVGSTRKGAAGAAATTAATASGAVAFLQARLGAGRRSKV